MYTYRVYKNRKITHIYMYKYRAYKYREHQHISTLYIYTLYTYTYSVFLGILCIFSHMYARDALYIYTLYTYTCICG